MKVYYSFLNSLQQFYDVHCKFYDRIEAWLEGSYLSMFPMNNNCVIFHMMGRGLLDLILPIFGLLLLQFMLLIFYEHVIVGLELHGWLHWHYDFT
jgi:hypothetical protein